MPTFSAAPLLRDRGSVRAPAVHPTSGALAFERELDGRWSVGLLEAGAAQPKWLGLPFEARMPAWSPRGDELAVVLDGGDTTEMIIVTTATMQRRRVLRIAGHILHPVWAPDGRSIAFGHHIVGNQFALRRLDVASGALSPLIDRDGRDLWPRWDSRGRRLVFFSRRDTGNDDEVYVVDSVGAAVRRITTRPGHDFVPSISPEGNLIAVVSAVTEGNPQLRLLDLQGNEVLRLTHDFGRITEPAWSPDGRRLVFAASPRPGEPYALFSATVPLIDPEVLIEGRFTGAEGLTFSHEGRLFIAADRAVWEVARDGATRSVAGFSSNLGLAPIGERDILMADFGPLVRPQAGPNRDGVVWRITPEGDTSRVADGIGDPNAIVKLPDGTLLVSDDFVREIYAVERDGRVRVFTDQIPFPNGLALSPDGAFLYVAQLFRSAPTTAPPSRYEDFSDVVWRLPLENGRPSGPPVELFRTRNEGTGPDGVAVDALGRVYLSAARAGELWRFDPRTGQRELLAAGLPGLASLAFGQGAFDRESLYATQIRGGRLLRFPVGATGARLER